MKYRKKQEKMKIFDFETMLRPKYWFSLLTLIVDLFSGILEVFVAGSTRLEVQNRGFWDILTPGRSGNIKNKKIWLEKIIFWPFFRKKIQKKKFKNFRTFCHFFPLKMFLSRTKYIFMTILNTCLIILAFRQVVSFFQKSGFNKKKYFFQVHSGWDHQTHHYKP